MQKCNCDVLNIVPADKRYVYNPVRIKLYISLYLYNEVIIYN